MKTEEVKTGKINKKNHLDEMLNFLLPKHNEQAINKNLIELGDYIKTLRTSQNWATSKLAELSDMSSGFINQLENGKCLNPKASSLTRLANIFDIDPNKLLYLAGYISNEPNQQADWQTSISTKLNDIGLKGKYVKEIIDYIETVQIKQNKNEDGE